ncbi:PAP2-domain-containing protein [Cucurbitaria berberidis CBS 394.84]|uniref:PAP2-domain-containing protein n=1 Tax=Cucurbitaria berberidis CBS 394.84 TaxID=1168544 RepID=A0A9P4GC78_9PLEO|nr:PAP2-domain-containing protein [Cucurbitaria berberidis CBS 394.84]KAF1842559.1 PAP2-domain-containing protein [Cucurbitaria berberidis CBS 394.84]
MGLFNKRNTPAPVDTTTATGTHHTHEKKPGMFARRQPRATPTGASSHNSRPTFGQWIKATALDIVTMAVMGAIGLGVYMADPAPSRSFPVVFKDGEIVYPEFAYPLRNEIIPIWAAALLAFFIPFLVFLIVQIRARSFWDVNNATIGLLYALISAAVFQVFIKWLIGGLRPHFLAVCKPVIPAGLGVGDNDNGVDGGLNGNTANGYRQIMFDRSICTGDKKQINDSLESMPSGHTTAAFAGFVFLYLYLNAKLKVFANYHPAMWKLIAIYAPLLGAVLIGGALTIDEYHNWYDIFAGAVIGTMMAFSAYRMVYAAVWDFRFNHIPLLRHAPFVYGAGPSSFDGFHDAIFTRKAGWGTHEGSSWGGAPGDAADGPRGTMAPHPDGPAHGHHHDDAYGSTTSRVQRKPLGADRHGEQMV